MNTDSADEESGRGLSIKHSLYQNVPRRQPAGFASATDVRQPQVGDASSCGVRPSERYIALAYLGEDFDQLLYQQPCYTKVKYLRSQSRRSVQEAEGQAYAVRCHM